MFDDHAGIQASADREAESLRNSCGLMALMSLALLVLAVYWPTLQFDFVNWDDPWYVINNPLIRSWHPSNLVQVATRVVTRNYAPLTIGSFLVDHTLWGLWAGGYHLTNVLLHAINTLLVYVLIAQLSRSRFVGWTTAALFAVHPVQIETVAWISSRKGLLSAAFILASLICWLRPKRTPKQEAAGLALFVAALLSKAIAVVVPAVVLLYDLLIVRRSFAQALARQFVPGLLALWLLFTTMSAQTTVIGGVRGHFELTKAHVLAVDTVILWRYIGMLICPANLCVLYDPPTSGIAVQIVISVIGWIAVAVAVFRCRERFPLIALSAAAFITFLIPVLNLFPITTLMNDRYLYLPSIPVFALAAAGLNQLGSMFNAASVSDAFSRRMGLFRKAVLWLPAATGVVLYGQMTTQHLPVWRNGLALWQHSVQQSPQLTVVQIQLANTLHQVGQSQEAVAVLEKALARCNPDHVDRKRIFEKLHNWRR